MLALVDNGFAEWVTELEHNQKKFHRAKQMTKKENRYAE